MPTFNQESSQSAFVAEVFYLILANNGTNYVRNMPSWLPEVVWQQFVDKRIEQATSDEIVRRCKSTRVLKEAYEIIVDRLIRDWRELSPDSRPKMISVVESHGLANIFPRHMLSLTEKDHKSLLTRWDAADMLFDAEKRKEFARLGRNAKGNPEFLCFTGENHIFNVLVRLLETKVDYDVSAVRLPGFAQPANYLNKIKGRTKAEYLSYLLVLRERLTNFLLAEAADRKGEAVEKPIANLCLLHDLGDDRLRTRRPACRSHAVCTKPCFHRCNHDAGRSGRTV